MNLWLPLDGEGEVAGMVANDALLIGAEATEVQAELLAEHTSANGQP